MDPIADFLTRIRNANMKQKDRVDVPTSRVKEELARIMKEEGFISNFKVLYNEGRQGTLRLSLKYSPEKKPVLRGLTRISKPGLRKYCSYLEVPRVRGGFGITILSTSRGVMTGRDAKTKKVGGEVLCQVW